jgi:hypothetical protein
MVSLRVKNNNRSLKFDIPENTDSFSLSKIRIILSIFTKKQKTPVKSQGFLQ